MSLPGGVLGGGTVGRSGARSDRWTAYGNIAELAKSPERAGTREPRAELQGPGEPAVV